MSLETQLCRRPDGSLLLSHSNFKNNLSVPLIRCYLWPKTNHVSCRLLLPAKQSSTESRKSHTELQRSPQMSNCANKIWVWKEGVGKRSSQTHSSGKFVCKLGCPWYCTATRQKILIMLITNSISRVSLKLRNQFCAKRFPFKMISSPFDSIHQLCLSISLICIVRMNYSITSHKMQSDSPSLRCMNLQEIGSIEGLLSV